MVKVGAAHVHAAGGQHVVQAIGQAHALRPQAHHGEVGGAAAHVHHQHRLLAVQAALVVQGCGDGLQLKSHFFKPDRLRRLLQRRLRQRVARRVVVHKMHGPAHHHARGRAAQAVRGTLAQRGQKGGDDVLKADLPVVDLGRFQQQRAAQEAFERAHQSPLGAFQVVRHGVAAKVGAQVFAVVEHGCWHGQRLAFERNQARSTAGRGPRHSRIGGAEIDAERARWGKSHGVSGPQQQQIQALGCKLVEISV